MKRFVEAGLETELTLRLFRRVFLKSCAAASLSSLLSRFLASISRTSVRATVVVMAFVSSSQLLADGVRGADGEGVGPDPRTHTSLPTLVDLATEVGLKPEMADVLWLTLEVDPETDLVNLAACDPHIVDKALESFRSSLNVGVGTMGRVARLIKRARELCEPPSAPPSATPPTAPVPDVTSEVTRCLFSEVLNQTDAGTFVLIDEATRKEFRARHRHVTGGDPPPGRAPNDEQLSALAHKLARGQAPYADFAVFVPFGKRIAKYHKFTAQVFVGGKLSLEALRGPSDFDSWRASWALFRACMISLDACTPATLDEYERGIASLVRLFPTRWGVIFTAEESMRNEQWKLAADLLQDEGVLPTVRPWEFVIQYTTYGGRLSGKDYDRWWSEHVVLPLQTLGANAVTRYLQDLDGTRYMPMPEGMVDTGSSSSNSKGANAAPPAQAPASKRQKRGWNTPASGKGKPTVPPQPYTIWPETDKGSKKAG